MMPAMHDRLRVLREPDEFKGEARGIQNFLVHLPATGTSTSPDGDLTLACLWEG